MEPKEENRGRHLFLNLSIIIGVIYCIISFARITFLNILTLLIEPFLFIILFILLINSFFYFLFRVRKLGWKAFGPLAVNILIFFAILHFPFEDISIALNFKLYLSGREKVVSMIQAGELTPNGDNRLISLPQKFKYLSNGGEVLVEQNGENLKVFFFTYQGVLDNFMGFAFISDNTPLVNDSFGGDFKTIKKEKDHWFWGVST